jgi:LysM repeat protein
MVLSLAITTLARAACTEGENAYQWTCHTATAATTLVEVATAVHANPTKLAEWNRLPSDAPVAAGASLRVPADGCVPSPGSWDCYEVAAGDTLASVARGPQSYTRDVALLRQLNSVLLWGADELHAGMQLKLPTPFCVPGDPDFECYVVPAGGAELAAVAASYGTSAAAVLALNAMTLGGLTALRAGMELRVPRRALTLMPPAPCVESAFWHCYEVASGDTLDAIAMRFGASPPKLAEWNRLADPDQLAVGEALAVAVSATVVGCVPRPGAWRCAAVPRGGVPGAWLSLQNLAYGGNVELLAAYNRPVLTNETVPGLEQQVVRIYPGQQIKQPLTACLPTDEADCLPANEVFNGGGAPGPRGQRCQVDSPYGPGPSGCSVRAGGANRTACETKSAWDTYNDCVWNGDRGVCEAFCDTFADEASCDAHTRPDHGKAARSCVWANATSYAQTGWAHGLDFFDLNTIYWANTYGGSFYGYGDGLGKWPRQSLALPAAYQRDCSQPVSAYCPQDGTQCTNCTSAPGAHFCYKPHTNQTLTAIGKLFGVAEETLCALNQMSNCSCLSAEQSFLKIPIS